MVKIALLQQRKKELNLSYDDITERTGCDRRSLIRIFKGDTPCPRIDTLQKIAKVLELPIDEITTDNDYKVTEPLAQTLTPFKQPENSLTHDEQTMLDLYRKLGKTSKGSLIEMLKNAVDNKSQR